MSWAELPLGIIDKIVGHAVKGDKKENEPEMNWFALRVFKYGQVYPEWSEAIRLSRNIFQSFLKHDQSMRHQTNPQQVYIGVCGGRIFNQPFIESDYLQAVKALCLYFENNSRVFDLESINDSIAARNSVEHFSLIIKCQLTEKIASQIIELLTHLTKISSFNVTIKVETQAQAEWLWQVMRVAVHTTSRPKTIRFSICSGKSFDWSFINRDKRLETGSIKEVLVICRSGSWPPASFFSHLAEINKMRFTLVGLILWRPDFLKATRAKRLQIECELHPTTYTALLNQLMLDGAPWRHEEQQTFTVDTIECLVREDGDYPVPQPRTFENDAEVWGEIKDWFMSTIENYRLFVEVQQLN